MEKEIFFSVLRQAMEQVYDSIDTYTRYTQLVEDPAVKQAMSRMVLQKQAQLNLLRQIGESARTSVGIPGGTSIELNDQGGLTIENLASLLRSSSSRPGKVPEKNAVTQIPNPLSECSRGRCSCASKAGIKSNAQQMPGNHKKRICISNRFH